MYKVYSTALFSSLPLPSAPPSLPSFLLKWPFFFFKARLPSNFLGILLGWPGTYQIDLKLCILVPRLHNCWYYRHSPFYFFKHFLILLYTFILFLSLRSFRVLISGNFKGVSLLTPLSMVRTLVSFLSVSWLSC